MSIKETLDLIDGSITDNEFEKELERMRFLRECRMSKFAGLYAAGLISKPAVGRKQPRKQIGRPKITDPAQKERYDAAEVKLRRINKLRIDGWALVDAVETEGWRSHDYQNWAERLGMPYNGPAAKPRMPKQ